MVSQKKQKKECNISKPLYSHIFRHSHVSLLAELNLPLKSIMERVGHSNTNTTLKIYNHVTKKTREEVIEALNNI
ncbi:tyrosine-type recombinase/integrase [Lactococcus formosensis]|uniref:tyrosine-type recombinase/integrase n=1 Tax=Lactococcus formosensis TaxID=1281486 RepID=UPI003851A886